VITVDRKVRPVPCTDDLYRLNVLEMTLNLTFGVLDPLVDDRLAPRYVVQSVYTSHPHSDVATTRSHPEMVGDMSRLTLNFDLSRIPFVLFYPGSRPILTPKTKHVHLLVLI